MNVAPQLQRLAGRVAAASGLAPDDMAHEIKAALHEAAAETGWLPPERRRASHEHYARHLVHADPEGRFSILAIVWDRGQMSPIHAHHCWCAVGVYQGLLTETFYRAGAAGEPPVEIGSARHGAGASTFDPGGSGIHRIANYSGVLAVSLHIYGVAGDRIATGVNRVYSTA
ncbi:MAG TPA: cysteine dioxygenase family protein [Burkholderiales bacterium]|nr:cysteine dioxygenase family protein [Burkholderiales bacterium]